MPDPEIRVGNWFADVTYERNAARDYRRSHTDPENGQAGAFYPYQRCYWYQIAKRTEVRGSEIAGHREMTVWTTVPLKAFTLLNISADPAVHGTPYHVNAALIASSVVNVFPRTIYSR